MKKAFRLLPLAVIPLFTSIVGLIMYNMITPIYGGLHFYDYDSAYVYLLNGIGLIQGYSPGHIDHPGTPLQLLCGSIAYVIWVVTQILDKTTPDFNAAVLRDPESYLQLISFFLLGMNALAIFYLGLRIWRASDSLAVALLAQTGFLSLGDMMPRLSYLSAEAMAVFAATMAIASLGEALFSEAKLKDGGTQQSVATAFFIALGLTTKVTCLPLVLLLAVLPTKRGRLTGLLALGIFTGLFLLPIYSQLPRVLNWLVAIGTHTGRYGEGEAGFLDLEALPGRVAYFQQQSPMLFLGAYACLAIIAIQLLSSERPRAIWLHSLYIAVVLFTVLAAQLLLAIKHFGVHYILPALSISSTILAWSVNGILERRFSERSRTIVAGVLTTVLVFLSTQQIRDTLREFANEKRERDVALASLKEALDAHPNAIVIGCYRVREQGFALQFGAGYLDPVFALQLMKYMPQPLSYNRWNDRLFRPGEGFLLVAHLNDLIAQGQEVLIMLPADVEVPAVQGNVLLELPDRERILKVVHVNG